MMPPLNSNYGRMATRTSLRASLMSIGSTRASVGKRTDARMSVEQPHEFGLLLMAASR
jgi:hypothetical protein